MKNRVMNMEGKALDGGKWWKLLLGDTELIVIVMMIMTRSKERRRGGGIEKMFQIESSFNFMTNVV